MGNVNTMDTNPWGDEPYRRRNRTGLWEGETESYRRRSSYRDQYSADPREGDNGPHRRRYEAMNAGPCEDSWEGDKNPYRWTNRTEYWEGETVYCRRQYKRAREEEENREHYRSWEDTVNTVKTSQYSAKTRQTVEEDRSQRDGSRKYERKSKEEKSRTKE